MSRYSLSDRSIKKKLVEWTDLPHLYLDTVIPYGPHPILLFYLTFKELIPLLRYFFNYFSFLNVVIVYLIK